MELFCWRYIKMKKIIFSLLFSFVFSFGSQLDSIAWYLHPVLKNENKSNNGGVSWVFAQNICKTGWHLPDKIEWELFLKSKNLRFIDLKDVKGNALSTLRFWTSSYKIGLEQSEKSAIDPFLVRTDGIIPATYKHNAHVICFQNKKKNPHEEKGGFYGITNAIYKMPGCIEGKVYVDYKDESLLQCKGKELKKITGKVVIQNDSIDVSIDTAVYSLKNFYPCTEGMDNKIIMLSDFRIFKCLDYSWKSIGYQKAHPIKYDSIYVNKEKYKVVTVDSITWFTENLRENAAEKKCIESVKGNCLKYDNVFNSNQESLCPEGWTFPKWNYWVSLYTRFGQDASKINFLEKSNGRGWWSYDEKGHIFAVRFNGKKFSRDYAVKNTKHFIRCVKKN